MHPKNGILFSLENYVEHVRHRSVYYLARLIVLFIFASILFFPEELGFFLANPILMALVVFGPVVLAVTLLIDLLTAEQRSLGSLIVKYFFLTISVIMAYGLFYYIDSTMIEQHAISVYGSVKSIQNPSGLPTNIERDVFYLSASTYFTIGYGDITPVGTYARVAAISEAFVGNVINLIVLAMAFQRLRSRAIH